MATAFVSRLWGSSAPVPPEQPASPRDERIKAMADLIKQLQGRVIQAEAEATELRAERVTSRQRTRELTNALEASKAHNAQLTEIVSELQKKQQQSDQLAQADRNQMAAIVGQLQQMNAQYEAMQKQVQLATGDRDKCADLLTKLSEQNKQLQQRIHQLENQGPSWWSSWLPEWTEIKLAFWLGTPGLSAEQIAKLTYG